MAIAALALTFLEPGAQETAAPSSPQLPPAPRLAVDGDTSATVVSRANEDRSTELEIERHADPPGGGELLSHVNETLLSDCDRDHYLLGRHPDGTQAFNRFQWWSKQPPASGAIGLNGPSTSTFECDFFHGLTTVVGSAVSSGFGIDNLERLGYGVQAWDATDAGGRYAYASLHEVPRIGFSVRTHDPFNVPRFDLVTLPGGVQQRVLVNHTAPGQALDPDRRRPPLTLDFAFPQRAVGLEYGFVNVTGIGDFPYSSVRLLAFDADGTPIAESNGDVLALGGNDVEEQQIANRIGVQDRQGRIVSVELHFLDRESGAPILDPQALFRVWHAPLPPAAVLEHALAIGQPPFVEDGETPLAEGPGIHELPFDHDRAMVFLRGFNTRFTDQRPHKISRLRARVEARVERNGDRYQAIVDPDALMLPSADNSGLANDAVVHYGVLSWSSTRTELFQTRISGWLESMSDHEVAGVLSTRDPCPIAVLSLESDADAYRAEAESRCGQIFAGVQDAYLSSGVAFNDQSVDELVIAAGTYDPWFNRGLGWQLGPNASIFDDDRRIGWGVLGQLEGSGSDDVYLEMAAEVLTGRSVTTGPDPMPGESAVDLWLGGSPFTLRTPKVTLRPPKGHPDHWFHDWDALRDSGMSWPLIADLAVVALRAAETRPGDELRALEFEVSGAYYDGRVIDWRMGLGVGAGNAVSGGIGSSAKDAFAFPQFAGVTRLASFGTPSLTDEQGLRCEGVAGLGAQGCDGWAGIVNDGEHQATIVSVAPGSHPQDARFRYTFLWRGERIYDLDALRARLPLQLRPGERLLIGAHYTPQDPGDGRTRWTDVGVLTLTTHHAGAGASLIATGIGIAPSPGAEWRPRQLVFEPIVATPGSSQQIASLVSTGATPLVISWSAASGGLYFEDATLGFTVVPAPHQPEPGALAVIVDYVPQSGSFYAATTELVADTNAGLIRIPVTARMFAPPGGL